MVATVPGLDQARTLPMVESFEELFREHGLAVFRLALGALRDRDAAQTVTQDCFWRAWRARNTFRGECSQRGWLMRIAVNLIRDRMRSRRLMFWKNEVVVSVEAVAATLFSDRRSPEAAAIARQRFSMVSAAVESLPQRQRLVFLLRFVEDMKISEIAKVTGAKEGTIKSQLFTAVRTVRKRAGVTE